ncbi:MAG: hypothetical protein AAGK01_00710, partial [Pseudomonadota bacterium]
MSEASFASLNPTLLARKGGAKPAMRPQLAPLPEDVADEALEDLGWNDMGQDETGQDDGSGADVVPITPKASETKALNAASPVVKRQQKKLEDRILADAVMDRAEEVVELEDSPAVPVSKPKKPKAKKAIKKAAKKGRRAAFTLRLD